MGQRWRDAGWRQEGCAVVWGGRVEGWRGGEGVGAGMRGDVGWRSGEVGHRCGMQGASGTQQTVLELFENVRGEGQGVESGVNAGSAVEVER